jgi:hypothetical protein
LKIWPCNDDDAIKTFDELLPDPVIISFPEELGDEDEENAVVDEVAVEVMPEGVNWKGLVKASGT